MFLLFSIAYNILYIGSKLILLLYPYFLIKFANKIELSSVNLLSSLDVI